LTIATGHYISFAKTLTFLFPLANKSCIGLFCDAMVVMDGAYLPMYTQRGSNINGNIGMCKLYIDILVWFHHGEIIGLKHVIGRARKAGDEGHLCGQLMGP
jgi:hypothetical protein